MLQSLLTAILVVGLLTREGDFKFSYCVADLLAARCFFWRIGVAMFTACKMGLVVLRLVYLLVLGTLFGGSRFFFVSLANIIAQWRIRKV